MFWFLWYHLSYKANHVRPVRDVRPLCTSDQPVVQDRLGFELEEYQCAICYGIIVDPVVGPCGHDFCSHCVDSWTTHQRKSGRELHCPVCRAPWRGLHRQPLGVCLRYKAMLERLFPIEVEARRLELSAHTGPEAENEERFGLQPSALQYAYQSPALASASALLDSLDPDSQVQIGPVDDPPALDISAGFQSAHTVTVDTLPIGRSLGLSVSVLPDDEDNGHVPQFFNGRYQIPPWYPPFQIMLTPVSRTIVELCRRALQDGEILESGDEDATYTSTDEILQQLKISIAFALGVQDDMRLFDHFFQNAIQMRVPTGWNIWHDWDQFRIFGEAILQRWPQDRPTLQVRNELLNEFQVALDDHSCLVRGQPGSRYFVLETLLDDIRLSLTEILRLPRSCPLPHLRSELGLRLLIHCNSLVWEDWDSFQEYAGCVLERWRVRNTSAAAPPPAAFVVAQHWQELPATRSSHMYVQRQAPVSVARHTNGSAPASRSPPSLVVTTPALPQGRSTAVRAAPRYINTTYNGRSPPHGSPGVVRQVAHALGHAAPPHNVHSLSRGTAVSNNGLGSATSRGGRVSGTEGPARRSQGQGIVQNRTQGRSLAHS